MTPLEYHTPRRCNYSRIYTCVFILEKKYGRKTISYPATHWLLSSAYDCVEAVGHAHHIRRVLTWTKWKDNAPAIHQKWRVNGAYVEAAELTRHIRQVLTRTEWKDSAPAIHQK